MVITYMDFLIRIALAIGVGAIIGIERQITGHAAGIRTNVLVSLGSCMFVLFPLVIGSRDIVRSAAQIITGVGFLGSGIIFKDGANVRGINTAATIWCTAAIGVLASTGNYLLVIIATLGLVLSNILLKPLVKIIRPITGYEEDMMYEISITCRDSVEFIIRSILISMTKGTSLSLIHLESADIIGDKIEIKATFNSGTNNDELAEEIIKGISMEEGVTAAGWELMNKS